MVIFLHKIDTFFTIYYTYTLHYYTTTLFTMVKNSFGGSSTKSMARKSFAKHSLSIRTSSHSLELLAFVHKLFSNGLEVYFVDQEKPMFCHLRGKFKGRNKGANLITVGSIVLVGLREWEAPNYKCCDLLEVYSQEDIRTLQAMPNITLPQDPKYRNTQNTNTIQMTTLPEDDFQFSEDAVEQETMLEKKEIFTTDEGGLVDFDDI